MNIGDIVRYKIRHVAAEEMLHASLVANLMVAIGMFRRIFFFGIRIWIINYHYVYEFFPILTNLQDANLYSIPRKWFLSIQLLFRISNKVKIL